MHFLFVCRWHSPNGISRKRPGEAFFRRRRCSYKFLPVRSRIAPTSCRSYSLSAITKSETVSQLQPSLVPLSSSLRAFSIVVCAALLKSVICCRHNAAVIVIVRARRGFRRKFHFGTTSPGPLQLCILYAATTAVPKRIPHNWKFFFTTVLRVNGRHSGTSLSERKLRSIQILMPSTVHSKCSDLY